MKLFGRKRSRKSATGIIVETAILIVVQLLAAHLLANANLLEHLLSPGAGSRMALVVVVMFLLLRGFVYVCMPGWLLARLFFHLTRPPKAHRIGVLRPPGSSATR